MLSVPGNLIRHPTSGALALSVESIQQRSRMRLILPTGVLLLLTAIAAYLYRKDPQGIVPLITVGFLVVLPTLPLWIWRNPVRGVYILVTAALLLEQYPPATIYPDDFGRYLPFFEDIATWSHISGISVSINEIFIVVVLLTWFLKALAQRRLRFDTGTMMWPIGLYMLMVVVGEVHGLTSGGDFRLSLWEVRSQAYLFLAYVLGCNLIKTRQQIHVLMWIFVVGAGLKGIQGAIRFYTSLHGNLHAVEALFPHEQSFFFNGLIVLTPTLFLFGGSRRMKAVAVALLPFVIIAGLANQRRAAVLALGVALLGLLVITFVVHPGRRRLIGVLLVLLAAAWPPYYAAYQNSQGLLGEVAHAVASSSNPNQRDLSSNLYRINEDKDILYTMQLSPIIGYGYGKVFLTPYELADISATYEFWNLLPHDSVLWVWMRTGTIGFILFWLMIGTALVQAGRVLRRLSDDPFMQGIIVFVILMIIQEIIFGYLDLQWVVYRNLLVIGILFAMISRVQQFAAENDSKLPASIATLPLTVRGRRVGHPSTRVAATRALPRQYAVQPKAHGGL